MDILIYISLFFGYTYFSKKIETLEDEIYELKLVNERKLKDDNKQEEKTGKYLWL